MTQASDDARRTVVERFVNEDVDLLDLTTMGWPNGVWVPSVDVWVNGTLLQPDIGYAVTRTHLTFDAPLLLGDTFRVAAIPERPSTP